MTKYYPSGGMELKELMSIIASHDNLAQVIGGDESTVKLYFQRDGFVAEAHMKVISPCRVKVVYVAFVDGVTIQPDIEAVRRAFIERGMKEVTK